MPDRVIKKMNQWSESTKREKYESKLIFLNRTKEKYDWDNDELQYGEVLIKDEYVPLTGLPDKLPGIDI